MDLNLEQRDYYIVGGGVTAWLVLSVVSHLMSWPIQVEQLFSALAGIAGLASIYFVYNYLANVGGEVGRYFTLIAMGVIYYTLTLVPHVLNHVQGNVLLFAYFFQHVMAIWSFLMIAYGAYLFYRGGR